MMVTPGFQSCSGATPNTAISFSTFSSFLPGVVNAYFLVGGTVGSTVRVSNCLSSSIRGVTVSILALIAPSDLWNREYGFYPRRICRTGFAGSTLPA